MKNLFKKSLAVIMVVVLVLTAVPLSGLVGLNLPSLFDFKAEAASFTPRLTKPSYDTYYKPQSSYNPFKVNYDAYGGNCTWYAWGRAYEITRTYPKLGRGNAGTWWSYNKNGGYYPYGSTPKLGAVACWSNSGAGHVAVVEQINGDGTIVISESGWSSCYFRTVTIPASGSRSGLTFQGFIYLGDYELDKSKPTITNVYITDISNDSFTVNCSLYDDVGVTRVWLNIYGPENNSGYAVEATNGNFSHTIHTSSYGGAGEYSVHIYAMDAAGNSTAYRVNDIFAVTDTTLPIIKDFLITDISNDSFTVNCSLYDDVGVTRVWLNIYGPENNSGYVVEATNGNFSHTIHTSSYGGAGEYSVHIYAMDAAGNSTAYRVNDIFAVNSYELFYDANGGTGAPSEQTKIYGKDIILSTTKPTKANYKFVEWNTKVDGTGTTYQPGDTYTKNADLTLYAMWELVHSHSYTSSVTKQPTCTEKGIRKYTCSSCADTYTEDITALDHTEGSWVITKQPSCTEKGTKVKTCTKCNTVLSTETIAKSEHDAGNWQIVTMPTANAEGLKVKKCKSCGMEMIKEIIPMLELVVTITSPSTKTVNYGDTLVLQLEDVELPEGWKVEWSLTGNAVTYTVSENGKECRVTSTAIGNVTVTATLIDENGESVIDNIGNEIFDDINLKSNANFWQKIVSFFKNLFRINRIIY